MRFATKCAIVIAIAGVALVGEASSTSAELRSDLLRRAAVQHGFSTELPRPEPVDPEKVSLGRQLFEEKRLSLNGQMSCRLCHLDRFGSSDGLPNAIGVGGIGEGKERAESDGLIVPRNALPLWGRGSPGFNTLFWDGKIEVIEDKVVSQFGDHAPSTDPLTVAVHLPFVEIREMVIDDATVDTAYKVETVDAAKEIYSTLSKRVAADPNYAEAFRHTYGIGADEIEFNLVADAIAGFIRTEFRMRETRFSRFLAGENTLTKEEIFGGLLFFGKGRCAGCHVGPYFTDFEFHAIPIPQLGFGKNGFGVDYGRFNVTHDAADLYQFRTPPLMNVTLTAPYGHAGSLYTLEDAITAHFDPLAVANVDKMDAFERQEFYKRLLAASKNLATISFLDQEEVRALVSFLKTLEQGPRQ